MRRVDISNHPCFNQEASRHFGRVHLPVAPRCNIECNYCNRRYDCANECRPGVTSRLMDPREALAYLEESMAAGPISVAGIAGPGDALANPENTFRTLSLISDKYPALLRCLSTNGLAGPSFLREITAAATHVTLTVNAVDHRIGARIYGLIRLGNQVYTGAEAAGILLEHQLETIRHLKRAGLIVKVNTVVIPDVNDRHVPEIARVMGEMSVDIFNAMPLVPVAGTPFADLEEPNRAKIAGIRKQAGDCLPQMSHCARCRADASGLIADSRFREPAGPKQSCVS